MQVVEQLSIFSTEESWWVSVAGVAGFVVTEGTGGPKDRERVRVEGFDLKSILDL